jgi:hypothetical protein
VFFYFRRADRGCQIDLHLPASNPIDRIAGRNSSPDHDTGTTDVDLVELEIGRGFVGEVDRAAAGSVVKFRRSQRADGRGSDGR